MTAHLVPAHTDELLTWLADGTLIEDSALDFKRQVDATERGRRDLAKDVAAMANNGGRLIIGIDKPSDGRPPTPKPTSLVGLAERVDQITRSRLDEPLVVATKEYPSDDEGNGFLLITIPPSPAAPHMVDGRYWGRSDVTNYPMPDAEVARLHQRRAAGDRTAAGLLQTEINRDPWPPRLQQCGHLFVVAQPTAEEPERLLRAIRAFRAIPADPYEWIQREIVNGSPGRECGSYWSPDLGQLTGHVWRRADGWAATTYEVGPGRQIRNNGDHPAREADVLELEIGEDGGLRLFCGRATDEQFALEELVSGLVKRVLLVARLVAATTGYVGSWDLGLAITKVSGVITHRVRRSMTAARPPVYSEKDYGETLRVAFAELDEAPDEIVGRLVGRFYRGLGREFDPDQLPISAEWRGECEGLRLVAGVIGRGHHRAASRCSRIIAWGQARLTFPRGSRKRRTGAHAGRRTPPSGPPTPATRVRLVDDAVRHDVAQPVASELRRHRPAPRPSAPSRRSGRSGSTSAYVPIGATSSS